MVLPFKLNLFGTKFARYYYIVRIIQRELYVLSYFFLKRQRKIGPTEELKNFVTFSVLERSKSIEITCFSNVFFISFAKNTTN